MIPSNVIPARDVIPRKMIPANRVANVHLGITNPVDWVLSGLKNLRTLRHHVKMIPMTFRNHKTDPKFRRTANFKNPGCERIIVIRKNCGSDRICQRISMLHQFKRELT